MGRLLTATKAVVVETVTVAAGTQPQNRGAVSHRRWMEEVLFIMCCCWRELPNQYANRKKRLLKEALFVTKTLPPFVTKGPGWSVQTFEAGGESSAGVNWRA